jgi:type II secretory pathway component PulJ
MSDTLKQTHAQLGATLLVQAAKFFRSIGEQNPALAEQMGQNAQTFEQVAQMLETDPMGEVEMMAEE